MARSNHCAIAAISLFLAGSAFAAQLVRDINAVPIATGTAASNWTELGSATLFLIDDGIHGQELWRTDGTASGTVLVKDINPGTASSNIVGMTVVGATLYFYADDGTNGLELWRSDGTTAGTHIVANINAGSADGVIPASTAGHIAAIGGVLYFAGTDASSGTELWRSDGTAAGTYRVSDICAGACSSEPHDIVVSGSRIFFNAWDTAAGAELWTSDGTPAGTHRVADIQPGSIGSDPQYLTVTTAGVFFTADDGTHGRELWFASSNGTGANLVTDLSPGSQSTNLSPLAVLGADVVFGASVVGGSLSGRNLYRANGGGAQLLAQNFESIAGGVVPSEGFVAVGSRLVFQGNDTSTGPVWVTDGTAAGTHQLDTAAGLVSTTLIAATGDIGGLSGRDGYYFFGYTGAPGTVNLWRTDGTDAGTIQYAALPQPFVTSGMAQLNGKIYFAGGRFSASGIELWSTDGTPAGTAQVADLNPGAADSSPDGLTVLGANLYFAATGPNGLVPWVSTGSAAQTIPLRSSSGPVRTGSSFPQSFFLLGSQVVFIADDGVHGSEPWVSDGTAAGTMLLSDIYPGSGGSATAFLGTAGSFVVFMATDVVHGTELWATDGTAAGTALVMDINPGSGSSNPGANTSVVLNGVVYFPADDGAHGSELWRSDGTTAGTTLVADVAPGRNGCISDMNIVGARLVFRCNESAGTYWWVSDGTAAGTQRITTAVSPTSTINSVVLNGAVYFGGQATPVATATLGQLWRTDGTAAGTVQVANLSPGATYTGVDLLQLMPGHVLFDFCQNGATNGCTYYASDGTAAGTVMISPDIGAGSSQAVGTAAVLGNRLVYVANTPTGLVLRVTDGTAAGTVNVLGGAPAVGFLGGLTSVQGHVVFTQTDPVLGPSVWRTDGTAASTVLVADIDAGTQTQFVPTFYTAVGTKIFFQAYTQQTGAELYVMNATAPNASDDGAAVANDGSVMIPVLANDGTISNSIDPTTMQIASPPGSGTASVNSGTGVVTYTPAAGFFGSDQFTYTVADTSGNVSNPATVFVTIAEPDGPAAGTAPVTPVTPPPTAGSSGGGGGGETTALDLAMLCLILAARCSSRRGLAPRTPRLRRSRTLT